VLLFVLQEGIGITEILNAIVERVPPPRDTAAMPLRALIFDRYRLFIITGPINIYGLLVE
jgi:translation elongation factor EF-4